MIDLGLPISRDQLSGIGADLAVVGAIISCFGVVSNNVLLNHVLAMQIWAISNPILFIWAFGLYRHWWHDGLSGAAVAIMYAIFTATNLYGLVIV